MYILKGPNLTLGLKMVDAAETAEATLLHGGDLVGSTGGGNAATSSVRSPRSPSRRPRAGGGGVGPVNSIYGRHGTTRCGVDPSCASLLLQGTAVRVHGPFGNRRTATAQVVQTSTVPEEAGAKDNCTTCLTSYKRYCWNRPHPNTGRPNTWRAMTRGNGVGERVANLRIP